MNKSLKKLWIKALRSGKYEQTNKTLRKYDGYCCLGVLCDVVKDRVGGGWHQKDIYNGTYEFLGRSDFLPSKVQELTGVSRTGQRILSNLNDSGNTFEQIANYIKRYY